jgi:D-aminopeptidase
MTGTHWIEESGVLETPILITNTNSVGVVRDAAIAWMVQRNQPGDFWYPVVAETADWLLNDIKGQHVTAQDTLDALNSATGGPIQEGNVGGGTGMICNGFKGGTGTSSRKLDAHDGGFTVGVLVQCNYGRLPQLRIAGIPVAREMKIQRKRCVQKQLTPPTLDSDGTIAPPPTRIRGRFACARRSAASSIAAGSGIGKDGVRRVFQSASRGSDR